MLTHGVALPRDITRCSYYPGILPPRDYYRVFITSVLLLLVLLQLPTFP